MMNTPPRGAANEGATSPQAVDSTLLAQQLLAVQQLQAQLLANGRGASMGRCKLPEFWEASPESWFIHAESLFANHEVQDDVRRYNLVIEALKPAIMQQLLDITRNPPGAERYATLKAKMLERFALSQEQRLRALFKGIDARGKKPSQLLREMRNLAGTTLDDGALKVKWLDLLPTASQGVLTVLDEASLDKVAEVADRIHDLSPAAATPATVAAVKPASRGSSPHRYDSSLAKEMANLTVMMGQVLTATEQVLEAVSARQDRRRSRSRNNNRAPSPARSGTEGHCYYHQRFGDAAINCERPCTHPKAKN